jgi:cell fate regulator YaaT (PSP1 superfamily)
MQQRSALGICVHVRQLESQACRSNLQTLKETFAAKIPVWQSEIKDIKKMYGDKVLGTCTVEQVCSRPCARA